MKKDALFAAGLTGGFLAVLCCGTPLLGLALGGLGLSAWAAGAEYLPLALILVSITLVGFSLSRRKKSAGFDAEPRNGVNS